MFVIAMVRISFEAMLQRADIPTNVSAANMTFCFPGAIRMQTYHVSIGIVKLENQDEDLYVYMGSVDLPEPMFDTDFVYDNLCGLFDHASFMVERA